MNRGIGRGTGSGLDNVSLHRQTFSSFSNPVFRLFYGGMIGQMAAMNMQIFARSWLIFRLTGSSTMLGVMSLAYASPMLFLSDKSG